MKTRTLEIKQHTSASGEAFTILRLGFETIGTYEHIEDGFLVVGCRKPVPTEQEAQAKTIQRYISKHIKLAADAARLLEQY